MDMSTIVADINLLLPVVAQIAGNINPAVAASIVAAERLLPFGEAFIAQIEAIKAAKAGVDPALWDQIVASNIDADAAIAASEAAKA